MDTLSNLIQFSFVNFLQALHVQYKTRRLSSRRFWVMSHTVTQSLILMIHSGQWLKIKVQWEIGTERQLLHDLTYMWNLKSTLRCESRMMIIRGWGMGRYRDVGQRVHICRNGGWIHPDLTYSMTTMVQTTVLTTGNMPREQTLDILITYTMVTL